ncbi:hypothetical protein J1G42_14250 [Cellulomonas sp. zg-ZUI222]|uniref:hypothetical protein n=1 Tax=Cellulomonas wangleii TaxID=2816956 RepID=UPI001A9400C1|nr:hypothetical protein [Cellulomonas wangleii]MBO0921984.1 hypothetical protein [Cellulomonas wangleii]
MAVRVALVAVLVVVALATAVAYLAFDALEANLGSGVDERRLDALETGFEHDPAAFERAAARMQELVAEHPGAAEIAWTLALVCARSSTGDDVCEDAGAADRALFARLPRNAYLVEHQAKDPGRTFFRFFLEDPPTYTVMYAPGDADPQRFADDRGFRAHRALEPGWTLLGPVPDDQRETEQRSG